MRLILGMTLVGFSLLLAGALALSSRASQAAPAILLLGMLLIFLSAMLFWLERSSPEPTQASQPQARRPGSTGSSDDSTLLVATAVSATAADAGSSCDGGSSDSCSV